MEPEQTQLPLTTEPVTEEPPVPEPHEQPKTSESRWRRLLHWYGSHKKWTIPATIIIVLLIWAVVPFTRYNTAGLVMKKDFTVWVVDAKTKTPVSGVDVSVGSIHAVSNGDGAATLKQIKVGSHKVKISKKYYKDLNVNLVVPILRQKQPPSLTLDATGRQAKIVVKNLITGKALANVDIKIADIAAKTDTNGEAVVVLPVGTKEQKAVLSLSGYNNSEATIKVSDSEVVNNNFTLTPSGKAYFISKRSGKLDVMKANLDGTEAKVVVAGTGRERDQDTQLMVSPDWKYVALKAQRDATYKTPQLYVLSTEDDELLSIDTGNAEFAMIGWSGENLIYYASRYDLPEWRTGNHKLKSYNAGSGKTTLLNQSSAVGDSTDSAYEEYDFAMISGESVIYAKSWYDTSGYDAEPILEDKKDALSVINANGQGNKVVASYDAIGWVYYSQHKPNALYIQQHVGDNDKFYEYVVGSSPPKEVSLDEDEFNDSYRIFYNSPSGKKSAWSEYRDGQYSVMVANADGLNPVTVTEIDVYDIYGWYGDDYLLLNDDDTTLYIMNVEGGIPIKIAKFHPTAYYSY